MTAFISSMKAGSPFDDLPYVQESMFRRDEVILFVSLDFKGAPKDASYFLVVHKDMPVPLAEEIIKVVHNFPWSKELFGSLLPK